MRFEVVTLFPDLVAAVASGGIVGRAVDRGLVSINCHNPRSYTHDRHRTVDDRPFGGGPGMLMKVEPLRDAILAARRSASQPPLHPPLVIFLSPQGRLLDQSGVEELSSKQSLVLVAGRYEGIDERVVDLWIDEEWSIGDYVLTGGELGAMVMIDAITRLLPGALGASQSALEDSFSSGLLDPPHYTRPREIEGLAVPSVLLGGDHEAIRRWRLRESLERTWRRRPELLLCSPPDGVLERSMLDEIIAGDHEPE
jgi:tRNA (guanine37-N1)-methyltransferase